MLNDFLQHYKINSDVHTEIRAQENLVREVKLLNSDPVINRRSSVSGVSARLYNNGVYGFASKAEYTPEGVAQVFEAARRNCDFLSGKAPRGSLTLPKLQSGYVSLDKTIVDTEQQLYLELCKELDAYIAKKYPKLISREVRVRVQSMEKRIVTNDGMCAHTFHPRSHIYVTLTASGSDGAPVEIGSAIGKGLVFEDAFSSLDYVYSAIDDIYTKVMAKCEGVYAVAGVKDCIFDPSLAGILAHEAVGHTVEADMVMGGSVAAHNFGKYVASPLVTLIDYAHTDGTDIMPFDMLVDDEGTPCKDAIIIKDGILVGYMNDRRSAQHFEMTPCGNARAYLFSDEPLIRMRNTAIVPGKDKLCDMIASVDDGYFFSNPSNGQADMTGEFMFGISMGYEIKNGKLGRAVRDTTISGVAFEMLKTITMISDNCVWNSAGTCGKKQPMMTGMGGPAIRCKVTVGGR